MPDSGKCPKCGKIFKKRSYKQVFCGDCIQEGKNKDISYRKCSSCGKIFEVKLKNGRVVYNSTNCLECRRKTMVQSICPKCKKIFYKKSNFQIFCSECIEEGKIGGYCYHICHRCGDPFKAPLRADGKSFERVCNECKEKRKAEAAAARKKTANIYIKMKKRRCHDCGTPTYNYRCDKCREKWQRLHNVNLNSSDIKYYSVWR